MEYPSLVWHLKSTSLFEDLELAEIEKVAASTPYRHYKAGEVIYRMDDPADALYFVKEGLVKISKFFPNGKEAILGVVGQYSAFGELLLTPEERRPTQAEAIEPTTLIVLPRSELQNLLEKRPTIALKFVRLMAERLFEAQSWSAEVSAYSAPERIASLLYRLALEFGTPQQEGTEISLKLNQEDMARMVGATRETVSHCLSRLKKRGAIVRGRSPILVNVEKLQDFIHGYE
ncbi:CRP/FNR family transcriptional regulator [Deinobacterium chartae]|uniref:CRP/FNR family transcriptional regulator n=1 Tax=Deinobacterium chartae TaxID=521158 RepID=A0A841I5H9_9DEIO|nr:Crp/Fnr family transcriptional regulator [Deinobacterium chartae]MBB6099529.1 CRP/FNR family transcriptional regulator [Deinobacterium chartae]